ncbi:hypothetical protein AKO1_006231 [Acrasis kona]|uniref:BAR domain-containing protein n=1 Tax=Acrasis kona TaxID=1008807 RepID=A0AAW2YIM2_9EUKA
MDGLKKSIVRGTQYLRTTMSGAAQTVDPEYNHLKKDTDAVQEATENLTKDFQAMIENLHLITKTMRNLSRELEPMYAEDNSAKLTTDPSVHKCKPMVRPKELDQFRDMGMDLDAEVFAPLQNEILDKINVPTRDFLHKFNYFKEMHKKRDNVILDMDYYKTQLKQYEEMSSKNNPPHKLYQKREQMKALENKYEVLNIGNKESMTEVLRIREETFDPAFDHLIVSLRQFGSEFDRVAGKYRFFNETVDFDKVMQTEKKSKGWFGGLFGGGKKDSQPVDFKKTNGWFYVKNGEQDQKGPCSFQELQNMYMFEKSLDDSSEVYCEQVTGEKWVCIRDIPKMKDSLRS